MLDASLALLLVCMLAVVECGTNGGELAGNDGLLVAPDRHVGSGRHEASGSAAALHRVGVVLQT